MSKAFCYKLITLLLIFGCIISQIEFIPSWKEPQSHFIYLIFIVVGIIGLVVIYNRWRISYKLRHNFRAINWIKSIVLTILLPFGIFIFFVISVVSTDMGLFFPAHYKKEVSVQDEEIYIYHNSCFPPDNYCECRSYSSLIYRKNKNFPIMHLLAKVDFYADNVQFSNNEFTILPLNYCGRDITKFKKIKLE